MMASARAHLTNRCIGSITVRPSPSYPINNNLLADDKTVVVSQAKKQRTSQAQAVGFEGEPRRFGSQLTTHNQRHGLQFRKFQLWNPGTLYKRKAQRFQIKEVIEQGVREFLHHSIPMCLLLSLISKVIDLGKISEANIVNSNSNLVCNCS